MINKIKGIEASDTIKEYDLSGLDIKVEYQDGSILIAPFEIKKDVVSKMYEQAQMYTKGLYKDILKHTLKSMLYCLTNVEGIDEEMYDEILSDRIKYNYYLKNKYLLTSSGIPLNEVDSYSEFELKQKVKMYK